MGKYDDILSHERYKLKYHKPMSMHDRAAQFSAFKALEGFEDEIEETARITDTEHEMTEDEAESLNKAVGFLLQHEYEDLQARVTYFKQDKSKAGGSYVEYVGVFKYYNAEKNSLVFMDDKEIEINSVRDIMIENDDF